MHVPMEQRSKAAENSFNAVRLLAALQVAFAHGTAHLNLPPVWGHYWIAQFPGVPIFFAISGYLVFNSMLGLQSVPRYVAHRASRIYPALLLNIAVIEILLTLVGQTDVSRWTVGQMIRFYTAYGITASDGLAWRFSGTNELMHPFPGFFQIYPSGVLWTLTVELTFYAVVPIIAQARSRAMQTIIILAASVPSLIYQHSIVYGSNHWPATITVIPYFWMFGIGMLFRLWTPPQKWAGFAIPVLLVPLIVVVQYKISDQLQLFLFCLTSVWIGSTSMFRSGLLSRNDISYGVYLWHMLFITALMNVPQGQRSYWLLLLALGASALAGWLSWRFVERPCMRWGRNTVPIIPRMSPRTTNG
jgi:peptidoglycan/LPS O-acetylase OafA/YrhL